MRKNAKYLTIVSFCAVTVLIVLIGISRSIEHVGGFDRIFRREIVSETRTYRSDEKLEDIAGCTNTHIYLKTSNPSVLKIVDLESNSIITYDLGIPSDSMIGSLFWTFVDSPLVRIMAGNARCMYSGNLGVNFFRKDTLYEFNYSMVIPISECSYIFRGPDIHFEDQFIKKYDALRKKVLYENNLVDKMKDGGISTDGTITYDASTELFIYSQFYRNSILCFDSNLRKISIFHSIDTCKHYQVEGARQTDVLGKESFTVKSVPDYVNLASGAFAGKLYLHSKQWAGNESRSDHSQQSVIDAYDLKQQKYLYSFYIPDYEGTHLRTFKIIEKNIFVLFEKAVKVYSLN